MISFDLPESSQQAGKLQTSEMIPSSCQRDLYDELCLCLAVTASIASTCDSVQQI